MAQNFKDLVVWQRAFDLTVLIYEVTQNFPNNEQYGITSQMRRASISIASNIAEGRGRLNSREFRQFLGIAQGSNFELRTQIMLAKHLRFGNPEGLEKAERACCEVSKMLSSLIHSIASNRTQPEGTRN